MSWFWVLWTLLLGTGYLYESWDDFTENQAYYNWYIFEYVSVKDWNYNNDNYNEDTYWSIYKDGQTFVRATKSPKTYILQWYLLESDCVSLETEINALTQACSKRNQQFKLKRRDWTIVFSNASVKIQFWERRDTTFFIPYTATVTVYSGNMYGSVINEQELLGTTSNITSSINYTWWNEKWLPYILLDCKTWTSVTWVSVTIGTNTVTIPVTLSNTDTLLINKRSGTIWKNWSPLISWTWPIPRLEIGANSFDVTFEWTPNIDVYLMYYPSYA